MLAYSSQVAEAHELGLSILSKLGEEIPSPSQKALDREIRLTQSMIKGISEVRKWVNNMISSNVGWLLILQHNIKERLLQHKMMTDTNKQYAMKFLARLQIIAYLVDSPVHPLVILKSMQITIAHGEVDNIKCIPANY